MRQPASVSFDDVASRAGSPTNRGWPDFPVVDAEACNLGQMGEGTIASAYLLRSHPRSVR